MKALKHEAHRPCFFCEEHIFKAAVPRRETECTAELLKSNNSEIRRCEPGQVTTTLTAQPEFDRVEEESLVVIAAVVALG